MNRLNIFTYAWSIHMYGGQQCPYVNSMLTSMTLLASVALAVHSGRNINNRKIVQVMHECLNKIYKHIKSLCVIWIISYNQLKLLSVHQIITILNRTTKSHNSVPEGDNQRLATFIIVSTRNVSFEHTFMFLHGKENIKESTYIKCLARNKLSN